MAALFYIHQSPTSPCSYCAEAGPDWGTEEVHREASLPHPDARDYTEDAGQRLSAGGGHQEDQGSLMSSSNTFTGVFKASCSFIKGLRFLWTHRYSFLCFGFFFLLKFYTFNLLYAGDDLMNALSHWNYNIYKFLKKIRLCSSFTKRSAYANKDSTTVTLNEKDESFSIQIYKIAQSKYSKYCFSQLYHSA